MGEGVVGYSTVATSGTQSFDTKACAFQTLFLNPPTWIKAAFPKYFTQRRLLFLQPHSFTFFHILLSRANMTMHSVLMLSVTEV